MLYTNPFVAGHTGEVPVIEPGVDGIAGLTVTAKVWSALVPHELFANTVMLPLTAPPEVETVIALVPLPEIIDQPAGTVQLYVVALVTAEILYTNEFVEGHTGDVPLIEPGVAGIAGLTTTAKAWSALVPHELVADTVMLPLIAAPEVDIVIALVPLPEVIDQPVGTFQLYEVALATAEILYTSELVEGHTGDVPLIAPGVLGTAGFTVIVI